MTLMKLLTYENHENSKHQNTNIKQIRMTEIQNSKLLDYRKKLNRRLKCFGHWNL
jgi:hypothetical protein